MIYYIDDKYTSKAMIKQHKTYYGKNREKINRYLKSSISIIQDYLKIINTKDYVNAIILKKECGKN